MTVTPRTDTGNAIRAALISPNETDSNMEAANIVDGLFAVARAITGLADVQAHNTGRPAEAIRRLAHGGLEEPTGLEALSMAINGGRNDDWPSVAGAIREGFAALAAEIREAQ